MSKRIHGRLRQPDSGLLSLAGFAVGALGGAWLALREQQHHATFTGRDYLVPRAQAWREMDWTREAKRSK